MLIRSTRATSAFDSLADLILIGQRNGEKHQERIWLYLSVIRLSRRRTASRAGALTRPVPAVTETTALNGAMIDLIEDLEETLALIRSMKASSV